MAYAQRLLKALGMGKVYEIGTWLCARYLGEGPTSVQNVVLHLARLQKKIKGENIICVF